MRHLSVVVLLGLAIAFSAWTLLSQPSYDLPLSQEYETDVAKESNANWPTDLSLDVVTHREEPNTSESLSTPNSKKQLVDENNADINSLPIFVKLLGTRPQESMALIEHSGNALEFSIADNVFTQEVLLTEVRNNNVVLEYSGKLFTVELFDTNLLQDTSSTQDYYAMSAEEIGNRPKVIEHILDLTPTPYIADGMLVDVGVSHKLFEQAGFKTDDVLKTVNGLSITIESEREQIQQQIRTADTLIFVVERRGRLIQLFLDIPEEALTLTR